MKVGTLVLLGRSTCILCVAAILGCSRSDTLPTDVTSALEQALTRHDLAASVALFADDAQILPQHGSAIRGRQEIEAYLNDWTTPKVAYDTDTELTLVRGDLGIEQGRYRIRNVRRGSDVEEGKYLHVWRRVGSDWKLYRMIYNTDVAPRTEISIEPAREEG
jgi:ketosteroid isomerase-like protein